MRESLKTASGSIHRVRPPFVRVRRFSTRTNPNTKQDELGVV